jgi:protein-S-isoprenylcysteine O-methyltransferase Ste14
MNEDNVFRWCLIAGLCLWIPIVAFYRIRSQRTREPLDRRQEGLFILATLRPAGLAFFVSLFVYLVNPARMAWAAMALPVSVRWAGVALVAATPALLFWTLRTLGDNLTDTVVTRKAHTLVIRGPYRWVRHPFYDAVAMLVLGYSLAAANWFMLLAGALVFTLLAVRAAREEARLVARFGDDYRAYMARTNRFLPTLTGRR